MADPQEYDQVAQANAAIQQFICTLPGGRIAPEHKPEYERLVAAWFTAVKTADEEPDPEPLVA